MISDVSSQIIKFKNLDAFEDLSCDFPGLRSLCNLIDLGGLCNLTGLKILYNPISSNNILILMVWSSLAPKWPILNIFLWNGLSKTQFFTNIWYPFWWRLLRPAYVPFLKTGWWNSYTLTSEIHRYLHFDIKVVFSWSPRSSNPVKKPCTHLFFIKTQ